MSDESSELSPRRRFEEALPRIDRIIRSTARRQALAGEEVDDFESWVHLRMIEDDYGVIRKFGGRSSMATYLTAVVQNLARDYRIRRWGRWRPSAAAERLGVAAVQLEILRDRDGFSLEETIEKLRADCGVRMSPAELRELAERLPRRARAAHEGGPRVEEVAAAVRADDRIEEGERKMTLARAQQALDRSLAELDVTDRLVLKMHYQSGLRISAIARALGIKQRELYTRRDRCLRRLRRGMEAAGLDADAVLGAVGWKQSSFRLDFAADPAGESRPAPSNVTNPAEDDV